ncbi:electron transport complex protein RnfD [Parabacteroides sp. PF5-5]|uniref:RnfABCDGE type electron transport complex subunit D n=1 Tax=unclassified Parabacteroides TaxID=2649774 RepID=UPI0024741DCD|nr:MULTISPECIES: RnfABCDGE type electron transport complex subunit D [unclassified Parabacteroides]MDH6304567.1 electron transport complex protein RnfD [Parabacteroides sp. PH5-39]MDH6315820.1 electron transport complex protein RnfD [Parabacteroides sp. PF5-13]MDH6319479.1 electron transport complex protein RnfD [Parabacteroides sp. PH5-13]MDH6323210.1 electron transport complex protein RnfD [Parabacteroides sp. PH5-8]MDH6327012.1 electron transport complex protein RnfD [Parabacteroides sp. PH
MENKLIISPSPHIHGGDSISKNMYGVLIALVPAFLVSLYYFGLGALIVTAVSVLSCVIIEYLIQKFLRKQEPTIWDGSAILTGVLLAFNLPSNLPVWIVIIGALAAIGIGKMPFGGLGSNIFNPALIGRVFLLISFPAQMTTWPVPEALSTHYMDAETGATVLSLIKGGTNNLPSYADMALGNMGGSLGEVSAIALLLGLVYMLVRKIITWHIPVAIIGTVAIFTGIMHGVAPYTYANPAVHLLSGGLLLGAIFMATDYVTSPMSKAGMIVYGIGIGVLTTVIRLFGSYPEGVSFAIIIMNALTPLINSYIKPKHFGGK